MRLTVLAAVALLTTSLAAQDDRQARIVKADEGKTLTLSGCLSGGAGGFVLSNAIAIERGADGKPAPSSASVARTYDLAPREGLALAPYVGHRVEVTGVASPPRDPGESKAAGKEPRPLFTLSAVKSVSPLCLQ